MAVDRERSALSGSQRYALISQTIEGVLSIIKVGFICGLLLAVAYWTREVLVAYAGKSTLADIAIRLAAELHIDRALAYLFGSGGILYGLRQRSLRQRNLRRLTPRAHELERRIDPNRTSSGLTPSGTTNPKDR